MKAVRVACEAAKTVPLASIQPFQGALKSLSEENFNRLRALILANGITSPIHVWKNAGKLWNLDGHQRVLVLGELAKDGYQIPAVPIVYVEAKDEKHAKRILLSNVAQFGHVESQGLYEFMTQAELPMEELAGHFDIPGIDMGKFDEEYFDGTTVREHERKGPTGVDEDESARGT